MSPRFLLVPFVNKVFVTLPLILLLATDGGRGDESLVALGATLLVAIGYSWQELRYAKELSVTGAMRESVIGTALVVGVAAAELLIFNEINTLRGPIASYGIISTMFVLTILTLVSSCLAAWADHRK